MRFRLPLLISAGFFLCHLFSIYFPRIEINVEVVEEDDLDDVEEDADVEVDEADRLEQLRQIRSRDLEEVEA